jgi:Signal transduction histidine kinase
MRELSLNVMDLAQNSLSAGAARVEITVCEELRTAGMTIIVSDNGCGMSGEQAARAADPFFTTRSTREVGLGVPLFKMEAEMTGGSFSIRSEQGKGTTVTARFVTSHVDSIPLGDINSTVRLLIACNPERDFVFRRRIDSHEFTLDTRELRRVLGGEAALNSPDVLEWIRAWLEEQTQIIKEEQKDEVFRGTSGDTR